MGDFVKFAKDRVILFDGAMGTNIQKYSIPDAIWQGKNGCNEYLNIVAPHIIEEIHGNFLEAGADVLETNSFGGTRLVLSEYGLEDAVYEINLQAAKIARRVADKYGRFVAGSIGPGTKLVSLGHISYDDLFYMYREQSLALMDGGVDLFIIETCQDMLQIKAAINGIRSGMEEKKVNLPIMVSVTVETNGTLLTGSDLSAVAVTMAGYPIYSLGINCALGPDLMYDPLTTLSNSWGGRISCIPNAGLPMNINGKFVYNMEPNRMAEIIDDILNHFPISIVGGCCGTSFEHIREMRKVCDKHKAPLPVRFQVKGMAASIYTSTSLNQEPPPALIGERANANGSKAFRELLIKEDFDGMLKIVKDQEEEAAHFVDICVAYAGRDEKRDMARFISMVNRMSLLPAVIDTTEPDVLEEALKRYSGKPVINSINFEDGGKKLHRVLDLVKDFPCAVIGLTIDEDGMAMTAAKKFEIAKRIYTVFTDEYGFDPEDLIIDPLTFSIGSGDETLRYAALETLEAIKMIKEELPGVKTLLGLSNVSFGLSPKSRVILNSVFLKKAVEAGLDMAIVHASKILPEASIPTEEYKLALNLINGEEGALEKFINFYSTKKDEDILTSKNDISDEEMLIVKLKKGDKTDIETLLDRLLKRYSPYDIINSILMNGMQEIGELFGQGKMLLPFVLQSAEVMKKSVSYLEKFMEKKDTEPKGKIVLATVKGDVHDIGKNLVDIILSNNGYRVYNLGIKEPVEEMIEKAIEVGADAIGMSGLLVKSTIIMKENLEEIKRRGLKVKVLLGGAALTDGYVKNECASGYNGEVYYCKDAFDAITYLQEDKAVEPCLQDNLDVKVDSKNEKDSLKPLVKNELSSTIVPQPPFIGVKVVESINFDDVEKFLNKRTLWTNRWGYKKLKEQPNTEYERLLEEVVKPEYNAILEKVKLLKLVDMKLTYGYLRVVSVGDAVIILDENENEVKRLTFPRQKVEPYLCLADYFKPLSKGIVDILPLQIVTLGDRPVEFLKKLKDSNYKEYFLYHGFFTEFTEALAEYWHRHIRYELGITENEPQSVDGILANRYRGLRYSFGYPSCPDLEGNEKIIELLDASKIGVSITETFQMVPEFTTSAIIVHSDKAKYFVV
ncbi:methionine synthase [Calditerrivibrio nitroreducens]|uniref:methionine synthase n=1 Tax=Calditerrivibrio nitroreducens TaxID=477976 RepID=UPI003C7491E9